MNYGMYIAASGASVQLARQEVFTNNLANVGTVGFRPHMMAVRARDVVRVEDGLAGVNSDRMLERLGGGVMPAPVRVSEAQGRLERTGRALDAAIEGKGFFVVRVGPGEEGLRLTRDGRFAIGPDGRLVTSGDGAELVGDDGQAIVVDASRGVSIRGDGVVEQEGVGVGRLRVADVAEAWRLRSVGKGLLADGRGRALKLREASGRVVQGSLEGSGVDALDALMGATGAARAVEGNVRMIGLIAENMQMAIGRFGRVS